MIAVTIGPDEPLVPSESAENRMAAELRARRDEASHEVHEAPPIALELDRLGAADLLIDFATLTGAARVALGADLPALFCNDDALADDLYKAGMRVQDPMWRLPL